MGEYTVESRLGPEDATRFAYGDEWYEVNLDTIMRLRGPKLIALEAQMGLKMGKVYREVGEESTLGMLALLWIARKLRHADIERFKDFDAAPWCTETRLVDEDGNVVEDEPVEVNEDDDGPAEAPDGDDPFGGGPPVTSP